MVTKVGSRRYKGVWGGGILQPEQDASHFGSTFFSYAMDCCNVCEQQSPTAETNDFLYKKCCFSSLFGGRVNKLRKTQTYGTCACVCMCVMFVCVACNNIIRPCHFDLLLRMNSIVGLCFGLVISLPGIILILFRPHHFVSESRIALYFGLVRCPATTKQTSSPRVTALLCGGVDLVSCSVYS